MNILLLIISGQIFQLVNHKLLWQTSSTFPFKTVKKDDSLHDNH